MNTPKIELTDKEKKIFFELANDNYELTPDDFSELKHLEFLGLGKGIVGEFGGYFDYELTEKAKAYIFENPKLKTPSILDDKKFWIELLTNVFPVVL